MRIYIDNVDFNSKSGPNGFGKKLAVSLSHSGHTIVDSYENPDVQLSFIQTLQKVAPIVQRLDGIYFNSAADWASQNKLIKETYDMADAVIAQSFFDKKLIEKFFGQREINVIHNGTDLTYIDSIGALQSSTMSGFEKVWSCASSWRPHKRLKENIRYFQEHAGKNDCLIIAGENASVSVSDKRIFYAGDLNYQTLISLFKTSDYFLHLAWLDHCPNVVVDAKAAGCKLICSSAGGTAELATENDIVILENDWNFEPCKLYEPPAMDFSNVAKGNYKQNYDISFCTKQYVDVLSKIKK